MINNYKLMGFIHGMRKISATRWKEHVKSLPTKEEKMKFMSNMLQRAGSSVRPTSAGWRGDSKPFPGSTGTESIDTEIIGLGLKSKRRWPLEKLPAEGRSDYESLNKTRREAAEKVDPWIRQGKTKEVRRNRARSALSNQNYLAASDLHMADVHKTLKRSTDFTPIEKEERLDSYKKWKQTGKLTEMDLRTKKPYEPKKGDTGLTSPMWNMFPDEASTGKPGEEQNLYNLTSRKRGPTLVDKARSTISERPVVLPGELGVHHKGLFFWQENKDPEVALGYGSHPGRGLGREPSEQAVLKLKMPSKYVIRTGKTGDDLGEVVVPAHLLKRHAKNVQVGGPNMFPPRKDVVSSAGESHVVTTEYPEKFEDMPKWESELRKKIRSIKSGGNPQPEKIHTRETVRMDMGPGAPKIRHKSGKKSLLQKAKEQRLARLAAERQMVDSDV
jgi:hypothetical protein